jgi:hypothetical protein
MKRINIVARYKENLDWIEELDGDVIVYNKGEDWSWNYNKIDVPNYGREAETFVRAIVDLMSNGKIREYDEIVLLQGNPLEHCPNLFEILKEHTLGYIPLCKWLTTHYTPKTDYIFNTHKHFVDLFFNETNKNMKMPEIPEHTPVNLFFTCADGEVIDFGSESKDTMYLCSIIGIPYKNKVVSWANGAQYLLHRNLITSKDLNWWKELHNLLLYVSKDLGTDRIAYSIERIWPEIWKHKTVSTTLRGFI